MYSAFFKCFLLYFIDYKSMEESNDECYKQILCFNDCIQHHERNFPIKINPIDRLHFCILLVLILTSQSNALPTPPSRYDTYPVAMVQIVDRVTTSTSHPQVNSYKIYRRIPHSSYSNHAVEHAYSPTNINHQQEFKRERYRRTMIERLFTSFDEDGLLLFEIFVQLVLSFI